MSEPVVLSLITAASAVLVAVVGAVAGLAQHVRSKRQHTETSEKLDIVQDQVKNSHTTNLRHDIDTVTTVVEEVKTLVKNVANNVVLLSQTVNNLDLRIHNADQRTVRVQNELAGHANRTREVEDRQNYLEDTLEVPRRGFLQ